MGNRAKGSRGPVLINADEHACRRLPEDERMTWVLIVGVAWVALAVVVGVVIARAIHVADEKEHISPADHPLVEDDAHVPLRSSADTSSPSPAPLRRSCAAEGIGRRPRRRTVVRRPVNSPERP